MGFVLSEATLYIYIYREREIERERDPLFFVFLKTQRLSLFLSSQKKEERERERERIPFFRNSKISSITDIYIILYDGSYFFINETQKTKQASVKRTKHIKRFRR